MFGQFWARVYETLVSWIFHEDTSLVEGMYAILAILWGAWLVSPFWVTFTDADGVYCVIRLVAPEVAWGLMALAGGVVWFTAIVNGRYRLRRGACFVMFLFWVAVATLLAMGNFTTTATVIYPLIALGHSWAFWRLGLREMRW